MLRFRKEKAAYEHLLHFGVVDAGIVPCCYGWLALSRPDIEKCCALVIEDTEDPDYEVQRWYNSVVYAEGPDSPSRPQLLSDDRRPPKALLLEWIPDASPLSWTNITPTVAKAALEALHKCHTAHVLHDDLTHGNILLLPGDRIMWIDFDKSTCGTETKWNNRLTRQRLLSELSEAWSDFYNFLVRVLYYHGPHH